MSKLFNLIAGLFGYLLNFIYSFVNNYGIAIIIFTVFLKIIMLPITIKQQKTMKKTMKMQAQVKEIQEKYSNDQVRQSQELTELYKRENMSPFSGCLTSIIQFIIILSMFYLVSRPLTFMKNVEPDLISKYVTDIIEETGETPRYQEIAVIKNKGNEDERVYLNMNFLGLELSDVPTQDSEDIRVFIIPVLYVITSIFSMKLTTKLNKKKENSVINNDKKIEENPDEKALVAKKSNEEDDAMDEMQKQMNMMMPVMTVMIALIAPLGLALYWLVSNLLMIIERLVINKFVKEEEE